MRAVYVLASLPASGVWAEIKDSDTAENNKGVIFFHYTCSLVLWC